MAHVFATSKYLEKAMDFWGEQGSVSPCRILKPPFNDWVETTAIAE